MPEPRTLAAAIGEPSSVGPDTSATERFGETGMLEAIRTREELFRQLTEALPVGVLHFDVAGRVLFTNPLLLEILGVEHLEEISGIRRLVPQSLVGELDEAVEVVVGRGETKDLELQIDLTDIGRSRFCQMKMRPLRASSGAVTGVIACIFDVTESVRLRDELQERANFDDLTACHNRASTLRHLARFLATGDVGVLFIDLDDFKPVNDTYGHSVGDELLACAAERLRANVRREDIVGRLGGDEFVILYPGLSDPEQLADLRERLRGVFDGPVMVGSRTISLKASFGSAFGATGANPDDVLASADAAMYSFKKRSESRVGANNS